jgi:exopolysaccharide biosynthesis protein
MKTFKKKTLIILITACIIGLLAYLAADRYLIKHIEIENVSAYTEGITETVSSTNATDLAAATPQAAAVAATAAADDWNYVSDSLSIQIREYKTGSGNDQVTYFVADVILADATQLESAFADNQFGRNIIAYTSQIAEENSAIFAINGDYYGFRSDGIVIRNGIIYRDEPARTGLAFYRDGTMKVYDETQTSAQELLDEGVWNTLSFGPALIKDSVIASDLAYVEVDTNFGNHPIQGNQPRTGVGIIDSNHFVFVVVDGRSPGYSRGVSLTEFAGIFQALGCSDAYNIDGGGSSTMVFMGRVVNNPLGKNRERGTSDILFIGA